MIFVVAFAVAALATWLAVTSQSGHGRLTHDHDLSGVQKMHATAVPRVGGVGIVVGMVAAVLAASSSEPDFTRWALVLIACAVPTFASGLTEDVTKRVLPRWRLAFTAASAALAAWWLGAVIEHTDVALLEWLVVWPAEAVLFTVFVVTGVTNSINLIDGFNGLASMCAMLMLSAIAFVAWRVDDMLILQAALALIGATLGFFVFNYPRGRIFLGDGGAYFVGFVLVELSVLLIHRHPNVSPMFPLLAAGYPIFETIFTMYRRRFVQRTATGLPDAMHLHHLFFRRQGRGGRQLRSLVWRNSSTSPWLWAVCAGAVVPAVCFWDRTDALLVAIGLFMLGYVALYRHLSRPPASSVVEAEAPHGDFGAIAEE
jgi:UDP-N-acetylmuramyl pentapeptide phosphotransferase/UDP-N-acetylglucosamine-1-phosphate transferase